MPEVREDGAEKLRSLQGILNSFRRMVRWDNAGATPAESGKTMSIRTQCERETLTDQLAIAYAFMKFRAAHGGGYPKPGEVAAARQEIVSDPACAKIFAPTESECASLLRQYGFEPPVVRKVNQKKT